MKNNLTIDDLYPSRYLKTSDIGQDNLVLTIARVEVEEIGLGDNKDTKPMLYFVETDKALVLNMTNANTIAELYGKKVSDWVGKRIALFTTEVSFQGKQTLGIRVRMRPPTSSNNQPDSDAVNATSWVE